MSKKGFLGKTLAAVGTIAAIGGVCYVFRDKIKESKLYKDLDVEDKVQKAKSFVSDKLPNSCDCEEDDFEDDFFYDDDEDDSTVPPTLREYTSITPQSADENNEVAEDDNSDSNVDDDDFTEVDTTDNGDFTEADTTDNDDIDNTTSIPTISFDDLSDSDNDNDSPIGYENDGLSDVSEDPDVLIDQDKLEF